MKKLIEYNKTTRLLQSVAGRTAWDQETMMPINSGMSRAMEMGALEEVIHERKKSSEIKELLETATPKSSHERRLHELIKRAFDRATVIPNQLASDLAKTTSLAQMAWQKARQNNNFSEFSPHLKLSLIHI